MKLLITLLLMPCVMFGAISGTNRGSGSNNTAGVTTLNFSPASNFSGTTGSWAVLLFSLDNNHAGGTFYTTFTVTDSLGNTWTGRTTGLNDPGAAGAGVTGMIFTTPQDGGVLQTGTTITATWDTAAQMKTWQLIEVTPTGGSVLSYVTGGTGTSGTLTTSPTITTGSITSGDIVFAGVIVEAGTTDTVTGDGDSTNGTWSTLQTAKIGGTTGGNESGSQFKVVTGTATQSYDPTLAITSEDSAMMWIQLTETVSGLSAQQKAGFFLMFP